MSTDACTVLLARPNVLVAPVSWPLPNRRRALAFAAEVAASLVLAAAVSTLVQWAVNRLPIPRETYVTTALTWSAVFVLGCAAVVVAWQRWSRLSTIAGWLLPAALTSTVQSLMLFGTPLYLFGTGGDQFFRMQYFQRLTVSASLADDNYAGLPPYYPGGWFWLGGRFANLTGHAAWAAYKPFAILTIAAVSTFAFVMWSLLVSRRKALGVALVLSIAGVIVGPYEPYSWIAITLVPPLAVLAWRLFRAAVNRHTSAGPGPASVVIGIGLSICAATYTLVFGFAVLLVVGIGVVTVVFGRKGDLLDDERRSVPGLVRAVVLRLVLIGLAALPITLLVWGPYLSAALRLPSAGNAAAQFYPIGMATLGTPMLQPSIMGAICMVGLIWIIVAWRRSSVAQAFGITAVACVLWQFLSTFALFDHTTLLPSHIAAVGEIMLWCACGFALFDIAEMLPGRFMTVSPGSARVLVSALAVLVAVELTQTPPSGLQQLIGGAFTSYDANGQVPDPAHADSSGRYNKQLIDTIAQLSGRRAQDNVVLTNDDQLLDFAPYHGFQTNKEQYANPLALYPQRNQELTSWATSSTSADFVSRLSKSKFQPPNVFVFTRDKAGNYPFYVVSTNFPYNNTIRQITFSAKVFQSPAFRSRNVGPYTVIARTGS